MPTKTVFRNGPWNGHQSWEMMYLHIYSILVFFFRMDENLLVSCCFSFKKKRRLGRPKKSARSFPSILRWSGGWSFMGSLGLQSMELLVERFNKKISQNSEKSKKGFGIGIIEMSTSPKFICGWWLDSWQFRWKIFDNAKMASKTQPLYISCGGYLYVSLWYLLKKHRFLANDRFLECQDSPMYT